jgi:hypothetical protein
LGEKVMVGPVHVCPLFEYNGNKLHEGSNCCGACKFYLSERDKVGCDKHKELKKYIKDNYGGKKYE